MTDFPVDYLPEPLRSHVAEGAAALDCDERYLAMPDLAGVGGAIGNTRVLKLKQTWREPAVVWCAPVGESRTLKTPAMRLAMEPINRRQKRLFNEHAKLRAEYEDAVKERKAAPRDEGGDQPEPPPPCQHLFVSDVTVEGLADRLGDCPVGCWLPWMSCLDCSPDSTVMHMAVVIFNTTSRCTRPGCSRWTERPRNERRSTCHKLP